MNRNRRAILTLAFAFAAAACSANHHIGDNGEPPSLTISPPGPLSLYVGQAQGLTVATTPSAQSFTWASSKPTVVSVDETGLASALSAGSATITATLAGGAATSSVQITAKQVGPIDPSFEGFGPCPLNAPGTSPTDKCPVTWQESNCDVTGACGSVCTVRGSVTGQMADMPTNGQLFLHCPENSEVNEDDVDFGPATSLTFDFAYAASSLADCMFPTQAYIRFRSGGTTTDLWARTLPCYVAGNLSGYNSATATVPIPPNLGPGKLMIGVPVGGGFIYIDNLRAQ